MTLYQPIYGRPDGSIWRGLPRTWSLLLADLRYRRTRHMQMPMRVEKAT